MWNMFRKKISKSKQSTEAKKRQDRQMYLAKEDPHPSIDISSCELSQFPDGIFSTIKIMRKETFVVGVNTISSFDEGGKLTDLYLLQSLDLSENQFTSLPSAFGSSLTNLSSLNLRDNKLESLPDSFSQLKHLTQLNLRSNKFKEFPSQLSDLEKLKGLDIQQNEKITRLPSDFARRSSTLTAFFIDAKNMIFPDSLVCAQGLEAIMKSLCAAAGVPYQSPVTLDRQDTIEDDDPATQERKKALAASQVAESMMEERRKFFEEKEDQKRLDAIRTEIEMRQLQEREFEMVARSHADKNHLNEDILKEECKIMASLTTILYQRDQERLHLMTSVKDAETQVNVLIDRILEANERATLIEAIIDEAEKDRANFEDYYKVKVEEAAFLRQKDVMESMRQLELLHNDEQMLSAFQKYDAERNMTLKRTLDGIVEDELQFDRCVDETLKERERVMTACFEEVDFQRLAYEKLLMEKDSKHERLRKEISLIEMELVNLTHLEVERKAVKAETDKIALAEHRTNLTSMLLQLIDEKGKREEELKKRLVEMEERREDSIKQYWLIQYQRLMDRKPQALMDDEYRQLEAIVAALLKEAGAEHLLSIFAENRITIETMMTLSDDDMAEIGVDDAATRKAVLKQIHTYGEERERATEKTRGLELPTGLTVRVPSAPPSPELKKKTTMTENEVTTETETQPEDNVDDAGARPSSSAVAVTTASATTPTTFLKLHEQTECVICLNAVPDVIFLPCGHVCGCRLCSEPLKECPLCRREISTKLVVGLGLRVASN